VTTPTDDRYRPEMPGELGRRFAGHSDDNLRFLSRPLLDAAGIEDVDDQNVWWPFPTEGTFPLDQLKEGSCTGHGSAHELAQGPVQVPGMTNAAGLELYRANQAEDRREGRVYDSGATVRATCQALLRAHRVTGYVWNKGLADTVRALRVGPVALGIDWSASQYETTAAGLVVVGGEWVGGHFIVLGGRQVTDDGMPPALQLVRKFGPGSWWVNTWGRKYGVGVPQLGVTKGCGFVPDDKLDLLLSRQGESVSLRDYFVAPPPTPVKPEPIPVPVPTPTPAPAPTPAPPRPRPGDPWAVWLAWWKWQQAQGKK